MPKGEKACDIYTLARNILFLDKPPTYLEIPVWIEKEWGRYAGTVRKICEMAIERRTNGDIKYIKWCEEEIEGGIVG